MAYNDQTSDLGKRTILYERVDRPALSGGARRILIDVLLPYTYLTVGEVDYLETNGSRGFADGGGLHMLPEYGRIQGEQHVERSLGVGSADIPQGITRGNPPGNLALHKFGWI